MNKTYEIFTGNELVVAEKIQQRRYQMLIHSCIYYYLNQNVISDRQWDMWAVELKDLQKEYPHISEQVTLYEYFKDWDASTGAFLPIKLDWVVHKAELLCGKVHRNVKQDLKTVSKKSTKKKLF